MGGEIVASPQPFPIGCLNRYGQVRTRYSDYNYSEFQRMMNTLDRLGYSQQTDEEYKQSVEKALQDFENETKE
ncbi:MAG: hypothetical protein ACOCPA_05820 [Segatella copri]